MRIDISFLPVLAATFLLVFARIGAMVMLLPGFGEMGVPVRIRLGIGLALTLILVPLHRNDYQIDLQNLSPLPNQRLDWRAMIQRVRCSGIGPSGPIRPSTLGPATKPTTMKPVMLGSQGQRCAT